MTAERAAVPPAPESRAVLTDVLSVAPAGLMSFQADGKVEVANALVTKLLTSVAANLDMSNAYIALAPLLPDLAVRLRAFAAGSGVVIDHERCAFTAGARQIELSVTVHRIQGGWHMAVIEDVTRLAQQERQVHEDRERFRAIFANIRDYEVYTIDLNGMVDEWTGGLQPSGAERIAVPAPVRRHSGLSETLLSEARQTGSIETEGWSARPDGSWARTNTVVTAMPDPSGSVRGFVVVSRDMTERKRMEAKIQHMAHHDALTGLPNRGLFDVRLRDAIARGGPCAVLSLGLDRFKAVNDAVGMAGGDALLRQVAARLRQDVPEIDVVARLGGDEFAVAQTGRDQPTGATALAARLLESLAAPYDLDGREITFETSIGIAVVPNDGDASEMLLKNAGLALRRAKADGRNRYSFFEPMMDALMHARRTLELDLRKALAAREFELYYQPVMDIETRSIVGFEALLRWHHPQRGMVPPGDFVPLAEELGLIIPLGLWALRQACAEAAAWPAHHRVAVNLSPIQFGSPTLVADVALALADSGLDPSRLELEITETVMLADTDAVLATLHRLHALGVDIAMDDFGTGYSSLSYLRGFPFDKVKIDRSFVQELGQGGDCDAIVTMVIELCKALGMTATAEGIETEAQLQLLALAGCNEAQGYLFSQPRPVRELAGLCLALTPDGSVAAAGPRRQSRRAGLKRPMAETRPEDIQG
jgi:diguanylate cyclase (GGDEF)-like protein